MLTPRDEAWRRLHDAATDATTLAEIARAHPEFAEAIRRHPNSYEALRVWADTVASSVSHPATSPPAVTPGAEANALSPESTRPIRRPIVWGALLGGALLAGGAVAAAAFFVTRDASPAPVEASPNAPTEVPSTEPATTTMAERRLDAPPVYLGEELSLFLLDPQQLAAYIPDAANGRVSDELLTLGEGEGARTDPPSCLPWIITDEGTVTGARAVQWSEVGWTSDSLTVRQFATPDFAEDWVRPFIDGGCAQFLFGQVDPLTTQLTTSVIAEVDERVFALRLSGGRSDDSARTVIVGRESNVVVMVDTDVRMTDSEAASLATLVDDRMTTAREAVTELIGYR